MKSKDAARALSQIDTAIADIQGFKSASAAEQSYLAKFLVVFISGIYEETIETIINEMVQRLGNSAVSAFVENLMGTTFRNPNIANVKGLVGKFKNPVWAAELDKLPQSTHDALNSICSTKNALAHGNPTMITLTDVFDYYTKSRVIIEKIDDLLL